MQSVYWNIQHFDLTRVTSYQITASHFHWELRARRHVLSCSTHVSARFSQLNSCTGNSEAKFVCVCECESTMDVTVAYTVIGARCTNHTIYLIMLKVVRRKQQNVFVRRKMAESSLIESIQTVWHTRAEVSHYSCA